MALTLAELLASPSQTELEARLLASLSASGFQVTDWFPGSVGRTIVKMTRAGLFDLSNLTSDIAAGGFLDLAAALDARLRAAGQPAGWLDLIAEQLFNLTRAPATAAIQRVELTCAGGTGPYTKAAEELIVRGLISGVSYRNTDSVTVPSGDSEFALFKAEAPGSAPNADHSETLTDLVTPLPGLTANNPVTPFGDLDTAGNCRLALGGGGSLGTITPSETVPGTPPVRFRNFTITVSVAGSIAAGTLTIDAYEQIDLVPTKTTTTIAPIPTTYTGLGDGITLTFADNSGAPSFLGGDKFSFSTPGSPLVTMGRDAETDESLVGRCRGRWPELSAVPTEDRYAGWVHQCSIDNGFGITKIVTRASAIIAGTVDIIIAGSGATPSGPTIAAIQAYVDARDGIVDRANVAAASALPISVGNSIGGGARVRSGQMAAVQAAAQEAWDAYLALLPIGGDIEGMARLAKLEEAIMDAGAIDVMGLQLQGSASNVALAYNQVAVAANSLVAGIDWIAVA